MSVAAVLGVIFGGLLVIAGIVWVFLTRFLRQGRRGVVADAANWLSEIINKVYKMIQAAGTKYYPGWIMIIFGIALIVLSIRYGTPAAGGTGPSPSPSPTVTVTPS